MNQQQSVSNSLALPFELKVLAVYAILLAMLAIFFSAFDLNLEFILSKLPVLIFTGATTTLYVSAISIVVASLLALGLALATMSKNSVLYGIATFYISYFRGTPLLLQVFLLYVGLPQIGIYLAAVPSAVIALSTNYSAYMAEIFRAGLQSIPAGQREAALSLGLSKTVAFRKVIAPQAIRIVIPPTANMFIAMLKDSSLVSILGVWDLMFIARTAGRLEFRHFEMLITAAAIYWCISAILEMFQKRLEARFSKSLRR